MGDIEWVIVGGLIRRMLCITWRRGVGSTRRSVNSPLQCPTVGMISSERSSLRPRSGCVLLPVLYIKYRYNCQDNEHEDFFPVNFYVKVKVTL